MPSTTRLALPYPSATDTADVPRDVQALADKLDPTSGTAVAVDAQGTLAARPAAGVRGRYYYATDVKGVSRDDGSVWAPVGTPVVAGRVAATGAITAGTGFTVNKSGTGTYVITFTGGFTPLSCTVTAVAGGNFPVQATNFTATTVTIGTLSGASASDQAFNFIAVGVPQ